MARVARPVAVGVPVLRVAKLLRIRARQRQVEQLQRQEQRSVTNAEGSCPRARSSVLPVAPGWAADSTGFNVSSSSSENTSTSVLCSQCGGENDLPTGNPFVTCGFCGTTLFVDRSQVVGHYSLPPLLGSEEATAALRRWMAGNDTVKDLDRKSEIVEVEPISFPVWLFRTVLGGGEEVHFEPAAPTPIPEVSDLSIPAGRLVPYRSEQDEMDIVDVQVPLETARGWLEQRQVGEIRETALVRVPFWKCRYRYEGTSYLAAVDASTGAVLAGVFPEKSESPYFLVAALGLILFGVEGLLIGNLFAKLVAYVITAVPLTLLAYWVARKV